MTDRNSQFKATKHLFMDALVGVSFPVDYSEWSALSDDFKVAALFVNFYPQITHAWSFYNKFGPAPITAEDAIDAVLSKFLKVIDRIGEADYVGSFIWHIAKNSIGDEIKPKRVHYRYDNEQSNFVTDISDVEEIDLFDFIPYEEDPIDVALARDAVWGIIVGMGPKAEKVARHLIGGKSLVRVGKNVKNRHLDNLADVAVSDLEYDIIVAQLKREIAPLRYAFDF